MRKVLSPGETHKPRSDAEKGLLDAPATTSHEAKFNGGLPSQRKREMRSQVTKLSFMIAMTFAVFLIELFYGYISNSVALIADAFHMLSDVLALAVALACILIANRKSKSNTFGWVRAEVVGALVNGVFLLALCFSIFIESVERLLEPHQLKEPLNVLIVGIIGLIVNVIGMFLFHGHSHSHEVHSKDKTNEVGIEESSYLATSHQDAAMSLADLKTAPERTEPYEHGKSITQTNQSQTGKITSKKTNFIGSVIVILTAGTSYWFPEFHLLKLYMDPVLSMIMVILIMSSTVPLVHETALILLQTTPDDVDLKTIEQKLMATPGVLAVHEFHVWRLVGMKIIATVHVRFDSLQHYLASAERIRDIFHDQQIHSVTVQPEFTEMLAQSRSGGDAECALMCRPDDDCKAATCCQSDGISTEAPKKTSR